jgi:IS5 family transposase
MKVHIGVDAESGLIHWVKTTAPTCMTSRRQQSFSMERNSVVYADAGYQGIAKRPEMEGKKIQFREAHMRAKGEHPFRVIKQQFGFQKTRLRGMAKNSCKVHVLAALTNLFLARSRLRTCTPA